MFKSLNNTNTFYWNKITKYTIGTVIKNTDGLVNRFASNMAILNQAHRVAWLIGQEKNLK